jgi:DNA-binding NtrC family response regulator
MEVAMARSHKILIVDDEKGIRVLMSDVLSSEGFEVSMAKDGQESLDQLEESRFDLVITDIDMPRVDGVEMLRLMEKAGRKEKVIVMSGNPSDRRFHDAAAMPRVVSRLEKPFRMDLLVDAVMAAFASRRKMAGRQFN